MTASNNDNAPQKPRSHAIEQKVEARVAAIKAVYSNEVSESPKDPHTLVIDMLAFYDSNVYENAVDPDPKFLKELVLGVAEHVQMLDDKVAAHLQKNWRLERMDMVMRALLRVAVFELLKNEKLPFKAIINEYVSIAHSFFDEKDASFVNGILDKIAKDARDI